MPLPAALAAKLAKRGLLKPGNDKSEHVEEVIAEDYDDMHPVHSAQSTDFFEDELEEEMDSGKEFIYECLACPNRSNSYHSCVDYCKKRWGFKKFKPDPALVTKHERLLAKYPPPSGWVEVGDPETGRYYYWNMETDEVSWLPPQHSRASITLSVDRLKELKLLGDEKQQHERDSQGESSEDESTDLDDEDDLDVRNIRDDLDDEKDYDEPNKKQERGKKRQRKELDPMDPAAYSDVPRGTWSTGLDQRGSAKTGVDVTVSGPLFQQRPYPSPGAVLRMNKESSKSKEPTRTKEARPRK